MRCSAWAYTEPTRHSGAQSGGLILSLLHGIGSPADLRGIPEEQLPALADEIRDFLVTRVSATGG
ncbi:MAG: 1-deoxy-D-xylulose-5-phosphate synthase N-terminal domain-containing protein, partial [Candidatus Nanopelagicales bacterium]